MAATKKKVVEKVAKRGKGFERPSVDGYFAALEPARRAALQAVRQVIARRMPKGYEQTLQYGMPTWVVPLATYPAGYLGKKDVPLPYVSLASQKQHMAVYLMGVYGDPKLLKSLTVAWKKSGKKLDLGKSCLRFKSVEDLALDALGDAIASVPVLEYVERYERARGRR